MVPRTISANAPRKSFYSSSARNSMFNRGFPFNGPDRTKFVAMLSYAGGMAAPLPRGILDGV
jgi:hypothetical protein